MKKIVSVLLVASFIVAGMAGFASAHYSGIVVYPYPGGNHLWISDEKSHDSALFLSSNNCTQEELDGLAAIESSTSGYSELYDFPRGYHISRERCDGGVDNTIDIQLIYQDCTTWKSNHPDDTSSDCTGAGGYGGENHHILADEAWCSLWNATYRCGWKLTYIHMNKARWNSRDAAWRKRLLLHELGHAVGLDDYCANDAAMNNGLSGCLGSSGVWTSLTGWTKYDRDGLFHSSHYQSHNH